MGHCDESRWKSGRKRCAQVLTRGTPVDDLKHIHFAPNPRVSPGWLHLESLESKELRWSSVPTQHLSSVIIIKLETHCVLKLRAPRDHDHSLSMLSINNRAGRTIHTVDQCE